MAKPRPSMAERIADAQKKIETHDLLTVKEAAAYMRVSEMTVYRLVKSREVPAIHIGRSYRIYSKDLIAYLDSSRTVS